MVTVLWSDKAKSTYYDIIEFLAIRWTEKEIHRFISRTNTVIGKITENPYLFQQYKTNPLVRNAVLHETVILIYQISKDAKVISLLTFWPARRNPRKMKLGDGDI